MAKDAKPAEAPAAPAGGNKKMMMIIIGVVALVLIGGAIAGYMFFMGGGEGGGDHGPAKSEKKKEKGEKAVYVTMDAFVVNIRSADDENHYLQLAFDVKVDSPQTEQELKAKMPEIRNKVLVHLSSKRTEDLVDSAGKQKLSGELKQEIDKVMGYTKDGVADVLFTSFVIQ